MLADSSPQGQQTWFMIEVFGVHSSMLSKAARLFEDLCGLQVKETIHAHELEASCIWVEELRGCRFHHVLPPTALGPRHATLAHKAHALLHSVRLEAENWLHMQDILSSVACVTSDQGVEMGLNSAAAKLDRLFPYWAQGFEMQVDAGIDINASVDEATQACSVQILR